MLNQLDHLLKLQSETASMGTYLTILKNAKLNIELAHDPFLNRFNYVVRDENGTMLNTGHESLQQCINKALNYLIDREMAKNQNKPIIP